MAGTTLLPSIANFFFFFFLYLPSNLEASSGFSIDLIHRDSPHSPFYNSSETLFDRVSRAIQRSNSRLGCFVSRFSASSGTVTSKVVGSGGTYLMIISLGMPPVQIVAVAETGSDLIWTQCRPCKSCYKQDDPLFYPSRSSTYHKIPCNLQSCAAVSESSSCHNNESCHYKYTYGDGTYTKGALASETFTMASTSSQRVKIPNVTFGCGHDNGGSLSHEMDGIVGLGGGPLSLVNNLGSSIDKKFAYCLAPLDQNASSSLDFGDNAVVSGEGSVSTPIITKTGGDETYYFLKLEKIGVGDESISLPSAGDGNIIIDSGTTLTYLPTSVYQDLVSALKRVIHLPSTLDPFGNLELCYEAGPDAKFPDLRFSFDGGDVVLGSLNTFVQVAEKVACFAFLPSDSVSIFGNVAQQNFKVGFDLDKKKLTFLPTDCAKN